MAFNLAKFLHTLLLPRAIADWSLTSLRGQVIKIGAKAARLARSNILQLAEGVVPRGLWSATPASTSDIKVGAQAQ